MLGRGWADGALGLMGMSAARWRHERGGRAARASPCSPRAHPRVLSAPLTWPMAVLSSMSMYDGLASSCLHSGRGGGGGGHQGKVAGNVYALEAFRLEAWQLVPAPEQPTQQRLHRKGLVRASPRPRPRARLVRVRSPRTSRVLCAAPGALRAQAKRRATIARPRPHRMHCAGPASVCEPRSARANVGKCPADGRGVCGP